MMNYFAYEKKRQEKKMSRKKQKELEKYIEEKNDLNNERLKNYWKRVENFMIQMVENPVVSNNASKSDVHNHKFRDEDPSKFKGNAIFIIQGFKNRGSHKERNTDDIDADIGHTEPGMFKRHEFRSRDIKKEIHQKDMKFGLNRYSSSIRDPMQSTMGAEQDTWNYKSWGGKGKDQKTIDPGMKTQFQGLITYYNKLNFANVGGNQMKKGATREVDNGDNQKGGEHESFNDIDADIQENQENKKQALNDFKDSYEMSKIALSKCKKIPEPQTEFLRAGKGHYVSMPDQTIRNNYSLVFYNQVIDDIHEDESSFQ